MAADVVGLANHTLGHDFVQRTRMIFHVEPVTHLITFSVHWKRFALQCIENDQRNQLFREVARAIVIRAVSHQLRQAVGASPRTHEVIRAGLACRVR
ncbi:hypothetical protein D3C87_1558740 [compost metagenome]